MNRRKSSVAVPVAAPPQAPINDQQYFRVAEAAKYLRITISSVRLAYRDGSLQGRILGKRLIFARQALDAFFGYPMCKRCNTQHAEYEKCA